MRALVVDGKVPGRVALRDLPAPEPVRGEALVDVKAISLNRGEMRMLRTAPDGMRPGWDFAGVLRNDVGDNLRAGTRVAGLVEGGSWAEQVTVRSDWLAPIPDGMTFEQAAALPTAGLTALRTLRLAEVAVGDRVLITAAAGGVGRFAVQLAALCGADVTALVTRDEDAGELRLLGASYVSTDVAKLNERFDAIIESVGGSVLGRAFTMLDPRGRLVMFGNSADEPSTFNVRDVYNEAAVRIFGFELFFDPAPFGRDLSTLAALVAEGKLNPHVADLIPWQDIAVALERLAGRRVDGKLVLIVG